jgi:hypothetical protein
MFFVDHFVQLGLKIILPILILHKQVIDLTPLQRQEFIAVEQRRMVVPLDAALLMFDFEQRLTQLGQFVQLIFGHVVVGVGAFVDYLILGEDEAVSLRVGESIVVGFQDTVFHVAEA